MSFGHRGDDTTTMGKALDLNGLLALHPWPEAWASEKRQDYFTVLELPAAPDALWRVLSDTSRVNRSLGVSEMTFEERDGKRWGASRNGGVRHEWVEVPWNWVAGQWLDSVRIYERGFSRVVYAVQRLEATERGSRLYVYFGVVARGALGAAALRLGFPGVVRAYEKVLPQLAAQLDRLRPPDVLVLPAPELAPEARSRLDAIVAQLAREGMPADAVARLAEWIRTGDEQDLARIQIRERARVWGVAEADLIRTALHATRQGMLALSWDIVCPHCRGVTEEAPRLGGVPASGACKVCDVDFGTGNPEAVEITFRVHPSIRDVPDRLFCSAEPAAKDHIRVQRAVAAGETVEVAPVLAPGRYRLRVSSADGYRYLDVDAAAESVAVSWRAGDDAPPIRTGPRPVIALENGGDAACTFVIEQAQWKDDALRPGHLLSLQEFRDLFADDYVAADVQLGVGEQTLLFTDMVGSTSFYASRGDPGAFVEVKRHFDEVFAIIIKHRGAIVKTIGDACMGAFTSALDAVKAAHDIHRAYPPTRADTPIRLRISLNTGPCIAVRLNTTMDYFGGTVNVAAKLQALAEAWQVAMSDATFASTGVAEYVAAAGGRVAAMTYTSKALPEPIGVQQWTVYAIDDIRDGVDTIALNKSDSSSG
jgi:class 3 adenylate cyclase